ncbi:MAG: C39 family peptidase [Chloroflexi bacterium]|nr:C39 family peptidase [Chloroflexota bacterium]
MLLVALTGLLAACAGAVVHTAIPAPGAALPGAALPLTAPFEAPSQSLLPLISAQSSGTAGATRSWREAPLPGSEPLTVGDIAALPADAVTPGATRAWREAPQAVLTSDEPPAFATAGSTRTVREDGEPQVSIASDYWLREAGATRAGREAAVLPDDPQAAGETRAWREGVSVAAPDPQPSASPAPAVTPKPPATNVLLGPLEFISQTVNNCGPASVAEVLDFWGIHQTQDEAQGPLRGDNPYGMTTSGVPAYVDSVGLTVLLGTGGTQEAVKDLLRAGFPVIVNQLVSPSDRLFHYRPVDGFDDAKATFYASDPLMGGSYAIPYDQFDQVWTFTGNRFMVIYPPDKQQQVDDALAAAKWDPAFAEGAASAQPWQVTDLGASPPVTTPVLSTKDGRPAQALASGWFGGPVIVTLNAADPNGFGIAASSYALDGGKEQMYRGAFTVGAPGKHTLTFHSASFSGGLEQPKPFEIDIAGNAPATVATVAAAQKTGDRSYRAAAPANVTLAASATNGLTVAKTLYSIDGRSQSVYNAPLALPPGTHTITFNSVDQAGVAEPAQSITVEVTAPDGAKTVTAPATSTSPSPDPTASGAPYSVRTLYDPTGARRAGGIMQLRLQVLDGSGKVSGGSNLKLTLQGVTGPSPKPAPVTDFRFDPGIGGYEADVTTDGLTGGVYYVAFTIPGETTPRVIQFRIAG